MGGFIIWIGIISFVYYCFYRIFSVPRTPNCGVWLKTEDEGINEVEKILNNKNFKTSKSIISKQKKSMKQLRVDTEHNQLAICDVFPYSYVTYINFSDIIECEIIEDSNTIMEGGVGRAVVGGALAGGVGAIVGSTTRSSKNVVNSLQIRIVTSNVTNSLFNINLISQETNKEDLEYKNAMQFANNVYATVQAIINDNNKSKKQKETIQEQNNNTDFEQLEKLAQLKEKGIITNDEFEESKKKILSKL